MKKYILVSLAFLGFLLVSLAFRRSFAGVMLSISDISEDLPRAGSYPQRTLSEINSIVIHHSASDGQDAFDYANYHIQIGRPGISYHYVIDPNGTINQTNPLTAVSWHVRNHNTPRVGICLSGNFNQAPPPAAQVQAAKKLVNHLRNILPNPVYVEGHADLVSTTCPGRFLKPLLSEF